MTLLSGMVFAIALAGCQSAPTGATSLRIAPGSYSATFQAVKDELRESGFELERIDARSGVITTRPRASAGLATPWVTDESTIEQEFEGLLNRQQRTVTVRFAPTVRDNPTPTADDLRDADTELRAQVSVAVERIHRVGLRPSTASVRLSSVTQGWSDETGEESPWTKTVVSDDDQLAARIIRGIVDRTGSQ